jgi:hypothetical protein
VQDVASDGQQLLVVWAEQPDDPSGREGLYAARVSPEGEVLDPAAIHLAPKGGVGVRALFDGANFLVVWTGSTGEVDEVRAARVSPGGQLLDATPIHIPTCAEGYDSTATVAGSDGARTLLVTRYSPEFPHDNLCFTLLDQQGAITGVPFVEAIPWDGVTRPMALSFESSSSRWVQLT